MEKDKFTKIISENVSKIKKIGLTEAENKMLFSKIISNINFENISYSSGKEDEGFSIIKFFGSFHYFAPNSRLAYATFGIALLLVSTSSVSFAAEKSLPGDILYPIKIKITEPFI